MPPLRYVPPAILVVDLVFLILHRAIDMGIPFDHHYIHAELLDTFRYLFGARQASERRGRGRGRGLRMRVGGRGGRRRGGRRLSSCSFRCMYVFD